MPRLTQVADAFDGLLKLLFRCRLRCLNDLRECCCGGRTPYELRIEGHTDNVPIHTDEFGSNWELSSARATEVTRILLDPRAIPADRLSAAGYAEFHPVDSNATAEWRANNRRIDLVVLPRSRIDFSIPAIPGPGEPWRKITDGD